MKNQNLFIRMNLLMKIKQIFTLFLFLGLLNSIAYSQLSTPIVSNGPLKLGQSIVTSYDPAGVYNVVRVIDIRNKPPFVIGGNHWSTPVQYVGANWTRNRMRNVFGIALDNAVPPNIYISSSALNTLMALNDSVLIYRIDGITWNVTNYVKRKFTSGPPIIGVNEIPNISGTSIGNICYDSKHNQLFATNFEDGKIYRIGANGVILSTYDPFMPDVSNIAISPLGERLFGIGVYDDNSSNEKLYFSVWNSDQLHSGQNSIHSIELDNIGEFSPLTATSEITTPLLLSQFHNNPVADIEFSIEGDMLIGERSMRDIASTDAHNSRIFEYERLPNGSYSTIPKRIRIGEPNVGTNSSGGVDYNYGISDSLNNLNSLCDSLVVGTGDYLLSLPPLPPPFPANHIVYGLQVTERSKGDLSNYKDYSHYVDINGLYYTTNDKTFQGDVDVYRKNVCSTPIIDTNCISIVSDTTYCDSAGTYIYEFKVHNNSPTRTVEQLEITVDSPGQPNYVVTMPSTINITIPPSGTTSAQRVKLVGPGAIARAEVCYTLSAQYMHSDCPYCCYIENCIKLPDCGSCVQVLRDSLYCSNNNYFFDFTLQNGTIYNVTKIQLTSPGVAPITFIPQIIHFATPIAPGQSFPAQTVQVLGGVAGMTIPVRIKLFSDDFECCYIELSETFDTCDSTTVSIQGNELNIENYKLGQNYPNPFNPTTSISFAVPEASVVEISIFDISGRLVKNLVNNVKFEQGVYSIKFDGSSLSSGMYYYRLKANEYIETRKMVLIK